MTTIICVAQKNYPNDNMIKKDYSCKVWNWIDGQFEQRP